MKVHTVVGVPLVSTYKIINVMRWIIDVISLTMLIISVRDVCMGFNLMGRFVNDYL